MTFSENENIFIYENENIFIYENEKNFIYENEDTFIYENENNVIYENENNFIYENEFFLHENEIILSRVRTIICVLFPGVTSGVSDDWTYANQSIKYSHTFEIRDKGKYVHITKFSLLRYSCDERKIQMSKLSIYPYE